MQVSPTPTLAPSYPGHKPTYLGSDFLRDYYRVHDDALLLDWQKRGRNKDGPIYGAKENTFAKEPGMLTLTVSGPGCACIRMRFREDQVTKVTIRRDRFDIGAGMTKSVLVEVSELCSTKRS